MKIPACKSHSFAIWVITFWYRKYFFIKILYYYYLRNFKTFSETKVVFGNRDLMLLRWQQRNAISFERLVMTKYTILSVIYCMEGNLYKIHFYIANIPFILQFHHQENLTTVYLKTNIICVLKFFLWIMKSINLEHLIRKCSER